MYLDIVLLLYYKFFFSSRRRHTRWPRDWSSDVCSSDLRAGHGGEVHLGRRALPDLTVDVQVAAVLLHEAVRHGHAEAGADARSEERRVGKGGEEQRWADCYNEDKDYMSGSFVLSE